MHNSDPLLSILVCIYRKEMYIFSANSCWNRTTKSKFLDWISDKCRNLDFIVFPFFFFYFFLILLFLSFFFLFYSSLPPFPIVFSFYFFLHFFFSSCSVFLYFLLCYVFLVNLQGWSKIIFRFFQSPNQKLVQALCICKGRAKVGYSQRINYQRHRHFISGVGKKDYGVFKFQTIFPCYFIFLIFITV